MGSPIGQAQGSGARRDGGRKRRRRLAIVVLVVVNCIVAVGAPIIDIWYIHNIDPAQVPFEAGAGLIAVTTFFGIWIIQRELDEAYSGGLVEVQADDG
jgi:hypothetical protein